VFEPASGSPGDTPVDPPVEVIQRSLATLLRLSSSRKVHAAQAAAAGVVVSQPGAVLLRHLHDHGPLPLGELARLADMDPAAASRQARQLEDDGLVERGGTPGDGRVTVVSLTPRGRAVERRVFEVRANHMADVLDQWSDADLAHLGALLDRFVADLRAARYRPVDDPDTDTDSFWARRTAHRADFRAKNTDDQIREEGMR
jgi:DNA-binding MarR family transcriptional regulator